MTLRDLPAVDALSADLDDTGLPRLLRTEAARRAIEKARASLLDGSPADAASIARRELARLGRMRPAPLVNATGVLLHTNLGRAPLPVDAAAASSAIQAGYSALELDLGDGRRGGRGAYVTRLLAALTGAEAALVVNNNAGALFLALAALAGGGRVVVSRGELIEIGGSFRLPELMAASGAVLVEVGTTNRTRPSDYATAAGAAAVILKVHPSNYRVEGFHESVSHADLAALAAGHPGTELVADIGSGLLDESVPWLEGPVPAWLAGEPGVRQTVAAGAGITLFSGDKLLGGPQAGIAVGTAPAIRRMATHPAARALRSDAGTLAALAATLELYADGRGSEVPFWQMASLGYAELEARAHRVLADAAIDGTVVAGESLPGAGSVPGQTIPSPVIAVSGAPDRHWQLLLDGDPVIVARRLEGRLLVDLRTVPATDDAAVAAALSRACR